MNEQAQIGTINNIYDASKLRDIGVASPYEKAQIAAIDKIYDASCLTEIAIKTSYKNVVDAAIKKIYSDSHIKQIRQNAKIYKNTDSPVDNKPTYSPPVSKPTVSPPVSNGIKKLPLYREYKFNGKMEAKNQSKPRCFQRFFVIFMLWRRKRDLNYTYSSFISFLYINKC